MCVERVQERRTRNAINSASLKARGILGPRVTANNVISAASRIVRVIGAELRLVQDVEEFRPELKIARLRNLESFEQRQIEIQPRRVIQKVPAGIAESQPARGNKL